MKRLNFPFLAPLIGVLLCGSAAAQEVASSTPPPLPPGPLLQKRAADMAAWSVSTKNGPAKTSDSKAAPTPAPGGSDKAPPAAAVVKVTVVKTGDIRVVQRLDEKSQAWNVWCLGTLQVMAWSDGKTCAVLTPPPNKFTINPFYTDFTASDFQGFEWLALDNYTAIETFMGRKCIVFKKTLEVPADTPDQPPTRIPAVAYVDLDSRLPISLQQGDQSFIYEWKAPPQTKLNLPENVQSMLDQRQRATNQLSKKAVKPF